MPSTNLVRPSRDGDQFHYLWAARRCLRLLMPQTELVAVTIEGPSPTEMVGGSADLAGEELIDIAEYYGDEDLSKARLVRYMQLKHSTLRAAQEWTASGLEKTLKGFAKRYDELLETFTSEELAARLEFWFVSNRPVSADVTETVADAAHGAAMRHPKELKKLEEITGLNGAALSAFCSLIHFEDRQDGLWDQRNILLQDVAGYLPDADVDAPAQLKELVTRKALSESEKNPTITKMDVLRALKTDEGRLFPAPCLIKPIENAVSREQEAELFEAIVQSERRPVVVHALAGVGKSIFSMRIGIGLPEGSVCIVYDCFGNGQYRSASGYRHRHQEALAQIANELAAKGLCHPLIPTAHADGPSYVRAFMYRLNQAVKLVRLAAPEAVLCIVVDAGDNAQMAAEEVGQTRSFVRDLLREALPEGVRLVVLCRSDKHRKEMLDAPVGTLWLELKPFSRTETASYLRQTFPGASEQDVDEFHRLSSQNPRVQALALSRNLPLPETLRLLGPNPTTVESAIGSLLNDAIAKLRDSVGPVEKQRVDRICAGLAALRPLIPISVLSQISGVSEEAVRSFALDLGRPLLVAGDTVQFLDEPVETWFREQFKPSAAAMVEFIRDLKPLATTSAYVASVLPQLMLEAAQFSELVALALTSEALPETSPLEKRDVELQRLQFALKASLRSKRYLDAAKLALKAGGETAGDDRQRKLIQSNTDLAAIFVETDVIQEIVSRRTFGTDWVGSHNAYEAGLLSGRTELVGDARSRLRMAYEWLRNWSRLSPEERKEEEVSHDDIAELCMAQLNIHGASAAARDLGRWKPREVSFHCGRLVARRLVEHGRLKAVNDLAIAAENNLCLLLAIVLELRVVQEAPSTEVVSRAFGLVSEARVKLKSRDGWDQKESVLDAVTALVEDALRLSLCSHIAAAELLTRYLPDTPPRGLSSRFAGPRFAVLRAYCLKAALEGRAVELIDLAHAELKTELEKTPRHHSSREAQEFEEDIGALLPWHQLWAAVLLGRVRKKDLPARIASTREVSSKAARIHHRDEVRASNEIALIWFDVLHFLDAVDEASLSGLTSWIEGLKRPLYTPTLNGLAKLGSRKQATTALALKFAADAFELLSEERADAESKSNGYVDVARSVLAISAGEAKGYFDEAVEVASKIGEENLARWDAILDLADRAARSDRPEPTAAYRFSRCAELTWDYVERDKHFNWSGTIRAMSALCPSSAFAILSRWRDRGFGRPGRVLPVAAQFLIERGALDARDALPLIGFEAEWKYAKLLSSVLERATDRPEKEAASGLLYRYMKWEGQTSAVWKGLEEVTKKHGLSLSELESFVAFAEREETSTKERESEQQDERGNGEEAERDWNKVFSGKDLTTVDGISGCYAAFKATPVPWHHEEYFAEVFRRVGAGKESAFIEAFGGVPEFDLYHLRNFLEQVPDAWKSRPAIQRSIEATLKVFCRRFCMGISKNRYYEMLPFDLACKLAGVTEANLVEVVLDTIGESPDLADSGRLFSLAGLLTPKLTQDEALEALTFGLSLFDVVLEDKDGDGGWSRDLAPPTPIEASIAGYIYAGLAAPASMLRWEAAHAVLGLCALGRHEVLRHLVSFAKNKSGTPFFDARLPFYQLHAQQWLLIALARAAMDYPAAVAPFAARLVSWALNDQDHVMIRLFAARAALSLIEKGAFMADEDLIRNLSRVNVTSLPIVETSSYRRVPNRKREIKEAEEADKDDEFYFGIDMGPYWYAPLGRVFALPQGDIEAKALTIIRDKLGYAGKGAWDEDQRESRKLFGEMETYASQSSYPRVDNHRFYLAYHAMMIAAGELLATMSTHRNPEAAEQDEFAEWLSGHDLSRQDGRWLADRRDPAPLEWPTWRDQKKGDAAYRSVTLTDFEEAFRSGDTLNVWGHWTAADSKREQTVYVRSALVSPDKSMALLRALSTASAQDYLIPSARDSLQIDRSGFKLEGWIEDLSGERELDERDIWSGGVRFPPPSPSAGIIELMGLVTDSDRRVWLDGAKAKVLSSQVWGHLEIRDEDNNPERGERLQASLEFIKALLAKVDLDLIVEVQIERRRRYRPYETREKDDERIPKATKLYLIKVDGSVTSV